MSTDWSEVYRSTFPDLVRYLYRKLWDHERAHDLAQEAFLRALDKDPEEPRAWVFTVAGNLARDELRKVIRRRKHLALIQGAASPEDPAPDPLQALELREKREAARRALDALGERDREILLLWDAELSYPEIADRMGLAPGAVSTTLARARQRLHAAYTTANAERSDGSEDSDVARG